jgi:H+/gluconate symporter-like permease
MRGTACNAHCDIIGLGTMLGAILAATFSSIALDPSTARSVAERADGCGCMVAKCLGISERDTLKTWTGLETVLSVAGSWGPRC